MLSTVLRVIIPIVIVVVILIALLLLAKFMYRVVPIDKALIITGSKEPKVIVSGGAFVIPIIRKADTFDLCMITVTASKDEILTATAVPIVADWTAQIRPDVKDEEKLKTAIRSFKERGKNGIVEDVKLTLMGTVRDVVASMTPEEVLANKEAFKTEVEKNVVDEMDKMGLELVSLNIQDVSDNNGYYENIASIDASDKQQAANIKSAEVERATREKKATELKEAEIAEANATRESAIAKMEAEQQEAEKRKEIDIKKAQFKTETDTAQANAELAKELQITLRQKEIEERKGEVEVTRQEQANLAAQKESEVKITKADAERKTKKIEAEADADVEKTKAAARVAVAEQDAMAISKKAQAEAEKTKTAGVAEADVQKAKAEAEAEGIKAKMIAEAEGIKAKKAAEAEGEKLLAEARAANDKVNFEIESLKIQTQAQIEIATKTAEVMANIGKNAEFVNINGGSIPDLNGTTGTGNILIDTLSQIPGLLKVLNTENQALNGRDLKEEIKDLSDSTLSGLSNLKGENTSSSK